jgi:archaellum component FlaF (FlaF/FlaG flagellin family)
VGFSVSAAVVIFAAALIYMATIFYPLENLSNHRVLEAKKNFDEMQKDKLNTKIVIANTQISGGSSLNVTVFNNGSVTLNSSKLNVIYNGTLITSTSFAVDNPGAGVWSPRRSINVTIYGATGGRVKIVTANGAADYVAT